ncbi:unnamed protein product [Pedinophyceae sp. YPF-701]|nr:unnamed protein product [Pedinophyceae sp. YPF-701]
MIKDAPTSGIGAPRGEVLAGNRGMLAWMRSWCGRVFGRKPSQAQVDLGAGVSQAAARPARVSSHVLFQAVLLQVGPQILDRLPQRSAINVAATCWAGLLTLLRHGWRVVRGDVEWERAGTRADVKWVRAGSGGSLDADDWAEALYEHRICVEEERIVAPVLKLKSVDGLMRGLARRVRAGTSYVGKLQVQAVMIDDSRCSMLIDVQDVRALYDAAVEAIADDEDMRTSCSGLASVLEASTYPGMTPLRIRRLRATAGSRHLEQLASFSDLWSALEIPAVCVNIEEICLHGCGLDEAATTRALDALAANAGSLRVLDICGCKVGLQGDLAVARLVHGSASLRELRMFETGSSKRGTVAISKAVCQSGTVKVLELDDVLGERAVDALAAYGSGAVERLDLGRGLSEAALSKLALAAFGSELVELTFCDAALCDAETTASGAAFPGQPFLASLVAESNSLRRLVMDSCSSEYCRLLGPDVFLAVANNPSLPLERLWIFNAEMYNGSEAISSMLAASSTLVDLRLLGAGLSDAAAEHLGQGLARSTSLRIFLVSGTDFGTRAVERLLQAVAGSKLQFFKMEWNRFPSAGVVTICEELSRSTTLRVLELGGDGLTSVELRGMQSFAAGLARNTTLRVLNISALRCRAGVLAGALRINRALRYLRLERIGLDDDGASLLALALKSNRDLLILSLDIAQENSSETARCMKEALQTNRVLEHLHVRVQRNDGQMWTDTLVRANSRSYPRIHVREN